ncbi:hypothetical protein [Croceicoccus naphthovorans]|uniref:Uncharacterized protein n=1 Tax=Croceicoccus naphthovorans TaxID=1348774 RepID=A0A0G3XGR7_9SPHN|nr:hypothetical protein [Croceicoccus naphthovorans]AKM09538.1 hypothetical protein AB433_05365 [Croceicoccus naphthovorans]MBB3989712.1 tetratricopeptide (TPR) repeat protein [Croceicoccus naphthovorans]
MRKFATIAGIALAATGVSGCQMITGSGLASADMSKLDMSEYFAQRIATGRMHLANHRPTRAITAFQQASYHPDYAGDAFNGMAIAYDQIGRPDLAARYFEAAMAAAPQDERFARNFARFQGREAMAMSIPQIEEAPVELAVKEPARPDVRGPIRVEVPSSDVPSAVHVERAPPVRVARVSQAEVAVGTDRESAVRTALAQPAAKVTVEKRSAAERTAMRARRGAQARKAYPIRIVLNDASGYRR